MNNYAVPGFKISFPEGFKRRGDFPYLNIDMPRTNGNKLTLTLLSKSTNFEDEFKLKLDPSKIVGDPEAYAYLVKCTNQPRAHFVASGPQFYHEVIRAGDYHTIPGAKEMLVKVYDMVRVFYYWKILIPVKNRVVEIMADVTCYDRTIINGIKDAPEGLVKLENTWRPIIDSLEFDPAVIAELPDVYEMGKNGPQTTYSGKGLKLSYPKNLNRKGDIFEFSLQNNVTGSSLELNLSPLSFDELYGDSSYSINPRNIQSEAKSEGVVQLENLRFGDYHKFPGAKELLRRVVMDTGDVSLWWGLLIPVGGRALKISIDSAGLAENTEDTWQPIIDSIELDEEIISKLPDERGIPRHSWKKATAGQSQHFNTEFTAQDHFVGLHSSKSNLFTKAEIEDEEQDEESGTVGLMVGLLEKLWIKTNKRLLLSIRTDPIGVPVDFYLSTDSPDENDPAWDEIIEGFINFSAGKIFASDCLTDDDPALEIVLPQKGIYKFRVYYGGLKSTGFTEGEHWQIYLWPTDETIESNEMKVIKAFENS